MIWQFSDRYLFNSDLDYWKGQPAGEAAIFRVRWIRNQLAHEAKKLTRRDIEHLFFDLIGAFLYVIDQLGALGTILRTTSENGTDLAWITIRNYCENILQEKKFSAWQTGYIELDLSETNPPGKELEPYDIIFSVVSRIDNHSIE